jgi:hypothetical protein
MKRILLTLSILTIAAIANAQIYLAKECEIRFFSGSPMENIEAVNKASKPILNALTGDVQAKIVMQAFQFEKSLMKEHFNENYVESDKYPDAIFKGKINEKIDYTKDGTTKVTVTGKLNMHGVEKEKNIEGTVTVKGQQVILDTKFNIHIADYNIKIPSVVVKNIAEDIEVKLNATLELYKK